MVSTPTLPSLMLSTLLLTGALVAQPDAPQKDVPVKPAPRWFAKTFHDAGKVIGNSKVHHLFKFKNVTDKAYTISHMAKTCPCANAWLVLNGKEHQYDSLQGNPQKVAPGQEGAVKILLDIDHAGPEDGSATIRLTGPDKKHRFFTVKMQATGVPYFTAQPKEIRFVKMKWNDHKKFSFTVTSHLLKNWNILDWKKGVPEGIKLEDPLRTVKDGTVTYAFKGSVGPNLKPGFIGGAIVLKTDKKDNDVRIDVVVEVLKPVELSKPHLGYGVVRRRRGKAMTLTITNKEPEHQLRLLNAKVVKCNRLRRFFDVKIEEPKPGQKITVTLRLKPGLPKGYVRGVLSLDLSHPFVKHKKVTFGAIVR